MAFAEHTIETMKMGEIDRKCPDMISHGSRLEEPVLVSSLSEHILDLKDQDVRCLSVDVW